MFWLLMEVTLSRPSSRTKVSSQGSGRTVDAAQLASYQEREALFHSHTDLPLQEPYRYLTLRRGILLEQEWIHDQALGKDSDHSRTLK